MIILMLPHLMSTEHPEANSIILFVLVSKATYLRSHSWVIKGQKQESQTIPGSETGGPDAQCPSHHMGRTLFWSKSQEHEILIASLSCKFFFFLNMSFLYLLYAWVQIHFLYSRNITGKLSFLCFTG